MKLLRVCVATAVLHTLPVHASCPGSACPSEQIFLIASEALSEISIQPERRISTIVRNARINPYCDFVIESREVSAAEDGTGFLLDFCDFVAENGMLFEYNTFAANEYCIASSQQCRSFFPRNAIFGTPGGVMIFQYALHSLGYNPGEIDGLYGRNTERAFDDFLSEIGADAGTERLSAANISALLFAAHLATGGLNGF